MDERRRAHWVSLNRVAGLGTKRFFRILREWGSAEAVWEQEPAELQRVLGGKVAEAFLKTRREEPEKALERVYREGISLVTYEEEDYPENLKTIDDPPPILFYRGRLERNDRSAVAIVGSRTPTPNGVYNAEELGASLGAQGVTTVSGLARGIDTAAHRGTLRGGGRTIAVLGSGINLIYPPENEPLAEQISENGAVISEFPLDMPPNPGNFPARNRIISGLSQGVLVVEAAKDSGSLITAGMALEQGREVFAVPGPIHSDACFGSNRLIRQGAHLVQGIDDILEGLNLTRITREQLSAVKSVELTEDEGKIIAILDKGSQHIDLIVRDSGLAASEVGGLLVVMELKGLVQPMPGKTYRRVR